MRQRHLLLKRQHRWKSFLRKLPQMVQLERLLPAEAFQLLTADLRNVRQLITAIKHRQLFDEHPISVPPVSKKILATAPRPTHELSTLNRAPILPQIVPKTIELSPSGLSELLDKARKMAQDGASICQSVDFIAFSMSWENRAELLRNLNKISRAITEDDVEITVRARQFWILFAEGRARHQALIKASLIKLHQGDWGFFSRLQLSSLLPGAVIPDHFERSGYLANYYDERGDYFTLDVYSSRGLPLFRHPFWPPATSGRERRTILKARSA